MLALCGSAQGGKSCFFVDGDCKPNPSGLLAGVKGAVRLFLSARDLFICPLGFCRLSGLLTMK